MPKITIDNREVEVAVGATVLDAAQKLGIPIPTMCYLRGHDATTSCMVCVVKLAGASGLVPACGTVARDGMRVESSSEEVREARRAALELLLSDHVGDCVGPCQMGCPAHMNIPQMIRQIAAGDLKAAIATVKQDIALPAVLGRICPAPCEKACRRKQHDEAVSICLLKRYVADVDLQSPSPYLPPRRENRGQRVAVIGAGPAGLAAAYYLQQDGFECTVFDDHDEPGGMLRCGVPETSLPRDVLAAEIAQIQKLGVTFRLGTRVGVAISMDELRRQFDAVFIGGGELKPTDAATFGVEMSPDGIKIDSQTHATNVPGVFAGGDAVRKRRLAVRAVADGKETAESIRQYLVGGSLKAEGLGDGQAVGWALAHADDAGAVGQEQDGLKPILQVQPGKTFNSRMGKLEDGEMEIFLQSVSPEPRRKPSGPGGGYTDEEARAESLRCLHCDCRKLEACLLRRHARAYDARQTRYRANRRRLVQRTEHPDVLYEPGKCIDCGICVQIASQAGEKLGLAFVGRGFDVRVAVPFDESLAEGLKVAAAQCVQACPTGALAFRDGHRE
ncbi:MAG: FAD-dependent oxidoreductase [Phycisphaerae bacterium]|nr:FAD-dependent oxidoreductase [Phycisphaerae bacterium]